MHIAPLQIEGVFYDYCTALGISEEKISKDSISDKLDKIIKLDKGFYSFEYFKYRFPIIRNRIAHGRIIDPQEISFFADFILLDLLDACKRITSDDLPLNKVLTCIQQSYDLNDKSSLAILIFALSKKFDIPEFYQIQDKVDKLKPYFYNDNFFAYLLKLSDLGNEIINGGMYNIIGELERIDITKKGSYVEIFKRMSKEHKKSEMAEFIYEIESNNSFID